MSMIIFSIEKVLDQITAHHLYAGTGFPCILRSLKQSIHGAHSESSRFSNPQGCASVNANSKKMKKKYSTKPVRRSLGEGGFFNLRALLGLTLCLFGVAM